MKKNNVFLRIWHDPVGSKVIAGIFLLLVTSTSFVAFVKDKLFYPIPIIIPIIELIIFIIILFVIIIKNRIKYIKINNVNIDLNNNIMKLMTKINANNFVDLVKKIEMLLVENDKLRNTTSENKNIPYSNRYELFKVGDRVKVRDGGPVNAKNLRVIEKTNNYIIVVDDINNKQSFSPEALSTVSEYEEELNEIKKSLSNNIF